MFQQLSFFDLLTCYNFKFRHDRDSARCVCVCVCVRNHTLQHSWLNCATLASCLAAMASGVITNIKFYDLADPLTCVSWDFGTEVSIDSLTTGDLRRHAREALNGASVSNLCYREEGDDGDYVTLVRAKPFTAAVVPKLSLSTGTLRLYYKLAEAPADPACLGPHIHQPPQNQRNTMSFDEWKGRCFQQAANDGCLSCLTYWLEEGHVDVDWESPNRAYTALDYVRYELRRCNGDACKKRKLDECKCFLEDRRD